MKPIEFFKINTRYYGGYHSLPCDANNHSVVIYCFNRPEFDTMMETRADLLNCLDDSVLFSWRKNRWFR